MNPSMRAAAAVPGVTMGELRRAVVPDFGLVMLIHPPAGGCAGSRGLFAFICAWLSDPAAVAAFIMSKGETDHDTHQTPL